MKIHPTDVITAPRAPPAFLAKACGQAHMQGFRQPGRDELFMHMLDGYRSSGGLYRGRDASALIEGGNGQRAGTVLQWAANHEVIAFEWQCLTWLPRFQFDMATRAPSAAVGSLIEELAACLDPWETALWFAHPSPALDGRVPADAWQSDPVQVAHAARHDTLLQAASGKPVRA